MVLRMSPSALDLIVTKTLADVCSDPIIGHFETFLASSALAARPPESIPRPLLRLALADRHD